MVVCEEYDPVRGTNWPQKVCRSNKTGDKADTLSMGQEYVLKKQAERQHERSRGQIPRKRSQDNPRREVRRSRLFALELATRLTLIFADGAIGLFFSFCAINDRHEA